MHTTDLWALPEFAGMRAFATKTEIGRGVVDRMRGMPTTVRLYESAEWPYGRTLGGYSPAGNEFMLPTSALDPSGSAGVSHAGTWIHESVHRLQSPRHAASIGFFLDRVFVEPWRTLAGTVRGTAHGRPLHGLFSGLFRGEAEAYVVDRGFSHQYALATGATPVPPAWTADDALRIMGRRYVVPSLLNASMQGAGLLLEGAALVAIARRLRAASAGDAAT